MNDQLDEALNVLGIPADSSRETVTSAYRRLARATHPDVSPDPDAAERFATVAAAYRVVSGVPAPEPHLRLHPRAHPEDGPASTYSFLRWSTSAANLYEPADFADDQSMPAVSDPAGGYLLGVPLGPARSWRRPPIVAGPVVVRKVQPDAGRRSR